MTIPYSRISNAIRPDFKPEAIFRQINSQGIPFYLRALILESLRTKHPNEAVLNKKDDWLKSINMIKTFYSDITIGCISNILYKII